MALVEKGRVRWTGTGRTARTLHEVGCGAKGVREGMGRHSSDPSRTGHRKGRKLVTWQNSGRPQGGGSEGPKRHTHGNYLRKRRVQKLRRRKTGAYTGGRGFNWDAIPVAEWCGSGRERSRQTKYSRKKTCVMLHKSKASRVRQGGARRGS